MAGVLRNLFWRASGIVPTADSTLESVDAGYASDAILPGWPGFILSGEPPSVADRQSSPSADDLLPQVLALGPRGPAWGSDEAGDGQGASPVMRRVWKALAAWVAQNNVREFDVATQALPSAVTFALPDWEHELGLPDPCFRGGAGAAARLAAVRARFAALGGQSPAYFICLAAAIGYAITIEEPTQFLVDVSEVGIDAVEERWFRIPDPLAPMTGAIKTGSSSSPPPVDPKSLENKGAPLPVGQAIKTPSKRAQPAPTGGLSSAPSPAPVATGLFSRIAERLRTAYPVKG